MRGDADIHAQPAHVQGRGGTFVKDREEADLVIAPDGDVSPFDTAKIMSEWV